MRRLSLACLLLLLPVAAEAMSLRVAPVLLDVAAPGKAAQVTLRNMQEHPVSVQMRIYRWSQVNGVEKLEPTTDVAVSPPMTTLAKDAEYTVRVVRTSARPLKSEDTYRLVVDELPDNSPHKASTVNFVLRQSIPVFFAPPETTPPHLAWSLQHNGGSYIVSAENSGGKRLRVSQLMLKDAQGRVLARRDGLVGYVLGGAQAQFEIAANANIAAGDVQLTADSEAEPVRATVALRP